MARTTASAGRPSARAFRSVAAAAAAILPAAAALAAVVGGIVLAGWTFGVPALTGHVRGLILTLPLTAALFVLGAAALWLSREQAGPRAPRTARVIALLVLAAALLLLLERFGGWRSPLGGLLFADALVAYPYRPIGVPATNSCICFVLFASGLLAVNRGTHHAIRVSQVLALGGLLVTGTALVGYLFGVRPLYAVDRFAGMAIPTAFGLSALLFGLLFARPRSGIVTLLTGDDLGAVLLRRLLPATLLIPILLGFVWIRAREHEIVTREGGVTFVIVATILLLAMTLVRAARVLRRADDERQSLLAAETKARAEAQQLAAALEVRSQEAEAASRVKSDFLATMSHELRTPLNAIIGYTQLLADEITGPLTIDQQGHLGRIRVSARHLLTLIEEILTLSRLEAGKETLLVERVPLADVLQDAASIVEPLAAAKGLAFRAACSTSLVIETDAGKLRQVVVNLLSNAVKFTDRGEVELSCSVQGDRFVCAVRDTGIGIEREHLERIFEPFWQVEGTATRRAGGTGLGLGVSRRLARLLGGDVTVESEPGRGSTFRIALPIAPRVATPPSLPAVAPQQVQRV